MSTTLLNRVSNSPSESSKGSAREGVQEARQALTKKRRRMNGRWWCWRNVEVEKVKEDP
jgi:hypothetical protein